MKFNFWCVFFIHALTMCFIRFAQAASLADVVAQVKPSVVGMGLYSALGTQKHQLHGTGFVIGDGSLIATNYHVVDIELDRKIVQYHIVFAGSGPNPKIYKAEIIAKDLEHDIAILKVNTKLPAVILASDNLLADGSEVLITGFPIGAILGLYPATHRGIIAAASPDILPTFSANQLTADMLNKLKNPYLVYQLDITAYPGNSGSPLYNAENGEVIGILNKVFIKETRESILEKPSGISYAIPIKYLKKLAQQQGITL